MSMGLSNFRKENPLIYALAYCIERLHDRRSIGPISAAQNLVRLGPPPPTERQVHCALRQFQSPSGLPQYELEDYPTEN